MKIKRFIIWFFVCFMFCPMLVNAGTWSHELIRTKERPWCFEALIKFERSPTDEITARVLCFKDSADMISNGPERVANIKIKLELNYSPLNDFDLGENSREIMRSLIVWIRNNPDATIQEAVAAYDAAYPDALWKGSEFFNRTQEWIELNTGQVINWLTFKNYVINNIFAGVDG